MKKYWAFCKANIQNAFIYRGPIFIWLAGNILSLVTIVAVWLSVSAEGPIGGYTKPELITYYVMTLFLDWLVLWLPFYGVVDHIRDGNIILQILVKPISLFWQRFGLEIGWHLISLLIAFGATLIVGFFFRNYFVFLPSVINFFLILLVSFLSILVTFTLSLCLGLLAFWFTEIYAVDSLFWAARTILSGRAVPLSFIPAGIFQTITRILPFRYMFSFPLEIYFNKLSSLEIVQGLVVQLIWIGILVLLYKFMWNRGRKAYTAFGQ